MYEDVVRFIVVHDGITWCSLYSVRSAVALQVPLRTNCQLCHAPKAILMSDTCEAAVHKDRIVSDYEWREVAWRSLGQAYPQEEDMWSG